MKQDNQEQVKVYRLGKMTILEIMVVLAVIGLVATWVLHRFFG